MDSIYLDNNATTRVAPEVFEAMRPHLEGAYGNASSLHHLGEQASEALDEARRRVADLLGASASEIVFTSGGTESNNLAIQSALAAKDDKNHIIISSVEHPSIMDLCDHLEKRRGVRVTRLGVAKDGTLALRKVADAMDEQTALVSVMAANNETGVRMPVEQIADLCAERKVPFHTDGVQAVGKRPVDLSKTRIGLLSLSAHKFHGPKGAGALYVRKGTRLAPSLFGGNQERKRRPGTENVACIVGLGKAAEIAARTTDQDHARLSALRDRLERGILQSCPPAQVNGEGAPRVESTSNISFAYVDAEAILISLDREGICASSGSACSSGSPEPSHVLRAMQVPLTHSRGSIRFSLSRHNTEAEVDRVVEVTARVIEKLRSLAPFGR